MFTLPLDAIVTEDNFNPRNYRLPENRDHLDELKRSIAVLGVQVPLLVRFDTETRMASAACALPGSLPRKATRSWASR